MEFAETIRQSKLKHIKYLAILHELRNSKYDIANKSKYYNIINKIIINIEDMREGILANGGIPRSYFAESNWLSYLNQQDNIEKAVLSIKYNQAKQEWISGLIMHQRTHKKYNIYEISITTLEAKRDVIVYHALKGILHKIFYNINAPMKIELKQAFYAKLLRYKTPNEFITYLQTIIDWYIKNGLVKLTYNLYIAIFLEKMIIEMDSINKKCKHCAEYYKIIKQRMYTWSSVVIYEGLRYTSHKIGIEKKLLFNIIINTKNLDVYLSNRIFEFLI